MGINNFSRRQCVRALKKLGFSKSTIRRRGKHNKFLAPNSLDHCNPPFIMIPRHTLYCQNEIIKELKRMGGDELVNKFRQYL